MQTTESHPEQPHLGPVQLTLGAYTGVQFDDNVNTSESNPESDTILRAGIDIGFYLLATEQSELRFSSQVGYATYLSHTRSDTVEIAPGSALAWNVSFDSGSVTLYNQFSYSKQVITVGAIRGLSQLPRFENTAGLRVLWQPSEWQFETGYSHDTYLSDLSAYHYLNRAGEYFFLRGGRRFAEKTQTGVEVSASVVNYELPIQSDNTSCSFGPHLDWQITRFVNASIRGGSTIYAFNSPRSGSSASDLNSYYLNFNLSHELTDFVSHQLTVRRDVNLGFGKGNNYTEQLTAAYSFHWTATRFVGLDSQVIYENGTQPLNGLLFTLRENYQRIGISQSASVQFTDKLSARLSGSHWERISNLKGNNYSENSIALELRYRF